MPRDRVNFQDLAPAENGPKTYPGAPGPQAGARPPNPPHPPRSYETVQFAFVPVGLSPANLAWIEYVIRRLKERGDRLASRSKVVRALIERHGKKLEEELFGADDRTTVPPSSHAP